MLKNVEAKDAALTAVQYAAKCGEKLLQAKAKCAHGQWLGWLEQNCSIKQAQAGKYMRLAKEMPQISNSHSGVNFDSINTAIAYLSAPEEVKQQVDASPEPASAPNFAQHI